jgi:hypothetical protein
LLEFTKEDSRLTEIKIKNTKEIEDYLKNHYSLYRNSIIVIDEATYADPVLA